MGARAKLGLFSVNRVLLTGLLITAGEVDGGAAFDVGDFVSLA